MKGARHHDLRLLRHLKATLTIFNLTGNCFQQSVAMVMDVPTAKLKIGTVKTDHRLLHAWVEDRGIFYDPSRFAKDGGLKPLNAATFIEGGSISDIHTVSRKWVLDFAKRGSLSRWMLTEDDTYHTLGKIMGHALLDELGIPYVVDDEGFLLPTEQSSQRSSP